VAGAEVVDADGQRVAVATGSAVSVPIAVVAITGGRVGALHTEERSGQAANPAGRSRCALLQHYRAKH
jgi:hypothetical protein